MTLFLSLIKAVLDLYPDFILYIPKALHLAHIETGPLNLYQYVPLIIEVVLLTPIETCPLTRIETDPPTHIITVYVCNAHLITQ